MMKYGKKNFLKKNIEEQDKIICEDENLKIVGLPLFNEDGNKKRKFEEEFKNISIKK